MKTLSDLTVAMKQTNGSADCPEQTQAKVMDMLTRVVEQVAISALTDTLQRDAKEILGNLLFVASAFAVAYDLNINEIVHDRYEYHKTLAASEGIEVK